MKTKLKKPKLQVQVKSYTRKFNVKKLPPRTPKGRWKKASQQTLFK